MISNKSSKQKCAGTGKWKANVDSEMNVLLLMESNKCSKNSIFPRITGLNNAKISINSCIALMEIDANFIMIMTPINSLKYL
jgi:hypothetical protein